MTDLTDPDILPPAIDPETKKIAVRHVKAINAASTRTKVQVRDFPPVFTDEPDTLGGTNTAPSPLETVLVALVGCDGVIINGVARAMDFDYAGVTFACQSRIDVRGPKGVKGVRPFYEQASLEIAVYTDESAERLAQLEKNVEFRCPVMNLMRAADVTLDVTWTARPAVEFPGDPDL